MPIRTRLIIVIAIAVLLGAGAVVGILVSRERVLTAAKQADQVEELLEKLTILSVLRTDWLLTRSDRAREQWLARLEELTTFLGEMEVADREDRRILDDIIALHTVRRGLVSDMLANQESLVAGRIDPEVASRVEERLLGQIIVQFHETIEGVNRLHHSAQSRLEAAVTFSSWFSVFAILFVVGIVGVVSLLVGRTVLSSVSQLQKGVDAVGAGDLNYRIDLDSGDELGQLADAFDTMSEELAAANAELKEHQERLEEQVRRRTDELERANAELDAYAHIVSHDLRSPLAAVALANAILRDMLDEEDEQVIKKEIAESTGSIERGIKRAHELIRGLLKLAESGQKPEEVLDLEISEVVGDVLEERAADIERNGVKVLLDADLGRLRANRTQIYQLFSNLIGNTIRHNDSPEPVTEVRYLGRGDGSQVYIVRDNSSGLSDEVLENLFKPFYRSGTRSDTGIGLAIVKKIVEVYGGEIVASNDNGACFRFSLPDWPGGQQDRRTEE